jgi:hypothetical protein
MFSQGAGQASVGSPAASRRHSDVGAVRLRQGLEGVSHRSGIGGEPPERRRLRQHRRLLDGELARSRARAGQIGATPSSQTYRPMAADVVPTRAPSPRTLVRRAILKTLSSSIRPLGLKSAIRPLCSALNSAGSSPGSSAASG